MKATVIKHVSKWKPNLTYNQLQALMMHFGGLHNFRALIINRCNASPTGLTAIKWNDTRLVFAVGMHEITMRAKIPAELGRQEVFTKPYAVCIELPMYPDKADTWATAPWISHIGTEAMFVEWLENCL